MDFDRNRSKPESAKTFSVKILLQSMRKKISAENKMEELLEFIRSKGSVSEDDAIAFCKQKFGVSPQTTYRYLSTLERAGLIRVKPDEITPWRREVKKTVNSNPLSLFCRDSPGLYLCLIVT